MKMRTNYELDCSICMMVVKKKRVERETRNGCLLEERDESER